ncbi:thioredoxin family protein [Desulfogranum marinum]|uniref:thioredoxin family protein n=1 Tax=Desulfogranum marinum TaxID=453220 RepID=UPI001E5CFA4D|nr:thioredoxin family protein [Desulfogranum marinum]
MMIFQVMGPGCAKCNQVAENAAAAAAELGVEYEIVKISDFNEMMKFGVMMTPALAIDGDVKAVGKVPTVEEIKGMLS